MKLHSCSVRTPGFCRTSIGIASLPTSCKLGRQAQLVERLARAGPDGRRPRTTTRRRSACADAGRARAPRARAAGPRDTRRRRRRGCTSARRGVRRRSRSAVVGSPASSGRTIEPFSASIAKPSPSSDSAADPPRRPRPSPPRRHGRAGRTRRRRAGMPARRPRGGREPGCEPHEQRVAARVAVGVVVALEPVQVVDREHRCFRLCARTGARAQAAAGAGYRARSGRRSATGRARSEQASVVDQADPGADEHGHDRCDREHVGDDVVILEVLVCEHGERDAGRR